MNRLCRRMIRPLSLAFVAGGLVLGQADVASAAPTVTADPSTNLTDGQVIHITVSGFPANDKLAAIQCTSGQAATPAECDTTGVKLEIATDASGSGSFDFAVKGGGPFANDFCDSTHPCAILVSNYARTAHGYVDIQFAGGAPAPTDPGSGSSAPTTSPPGATPAGSTPAATAAATSGNSALANTGIDLRLYLAIVSGLVLLGIVAAMGRHRLLRQR
jgi:Neocarzinostatin family